MIYVLVNYFQSEIVQTWNAFLHNASDQILFTSSGFEGEFRIKFAIELFCQCLRAVLEYHLWTYKILGLVIIVLYVRLHSYES